jgi:Icc-related predicted phosphoesterase
MAEGSENRDCVRILHLSDTHSLHRTIEDRFPLPEAEMLIHTGDFTDTGAPSEVDDFNQWLGDLRSRYKHIIVILGNHEWTGLKRGTTTQIASLVQAAVDTKTYVQSVLTNATVLVHEEVHVFGLRIFGSSWVPWHCSHDPDDEMSAHQIAGYKQARFASQGTAVNSDGEVVPKGHHHMFGTIPKGVDILLSHGPPQGILDQMEGTGRAWGSSKALRKQIEIVRPTVHLFGHLHEQRGAWHRPNTTVPFDGGIEYEAKKGVPFPTWEAPPPDYPCQLIACTAMKNHPGLDGAPARIAGPARLIVAARGHDQPWHFTLA